MYLTKRRGIWTFRKAIPKDLVPIFGRQDVRCSLRTTIARVAHQRALGMLVSVEDIFSVLQGQKPTDEARALAIKLLQDAMSMLSGTAWSFEMRHRKLSATVSELQAMEASARATAEAEGQSIDYEQLKQAFSEQIKAAIADGHQAKYSADLLSVKIEKYKSKIEPRLNGKHKEDVPRRLDFFLGVVGDMPVRDLRRSHIETYRDMLDCLPEKFSQRLKTSDPRKAIELNAKRPRPFNVISPVTVDLKYLGPVRRMLDDLAAGGEIERNPATGIQSLRTKEERRTTAPNKKRLPFTPEQLNKVLAEASTRSRASALFWTPPGMLYTGARLNEWAQLRTDDIVIHNGRPHLSIVCLDDEDGEMVGDPQKADLRRTKSAAARRLIPLHPELVEIGFLDFVESRRGKAGSHGQLFRELRPDKWGYYSGALSKSLNRLIRRAGVVGRLRSAYSFRHNFSDACDAAGMPERAKNKLMGHQLPGAPGIYGNPRPEPHESEWIAKLEYPGIDLQGYAKAPSRGRKSASHGRDQQDHICPSPLSAAVAERSDHPHGRA